MTIFKWVMKPVESVYRFTRVLGSRGNYTDMRSLPPKTSLPLDNNACVQAIGIGTMPDTD